MNDYIKSGLSRYLIDPDDGLWTRRKIAGQVSTFVTERFPLTGWTKNLAKIPLQFCYGSLYEYLVNRKVAFISGCESDDKEEVVFVNLSCAVKPLRKGYQYYSSDHVSDVQLCEGIGKVYVRAKVLLSIKDKNYQSWICISRDGLAVDARGHCVRKKEGDVIT